MNLELILAAIAAVESGNCDTKIGRYGELTRYQITRTVWKQHTTMPFRKDYGMRPGLAKIIATRHYESVQKSVPGRIGEPERVFWVAAVWNCGSNRCWRSKWNRFLLPHKTIDYADRVKNIYETLAAEEKRAFETRTKIRAPLAGARRNPAQNRVAVRPR